MHIKEAIWGVRMHNTIVDMVFVILLLDLFQIGTLELSCKLGPFLQVFVQTGTSGANLDHYIKLLEILVKQKLLIFSKKSVNYLCPNNQVYFCNLHGVGY